MKERERGKEGEGGGRGRMIPGPWGDRRPYVNVCNVHPSDVIAGVTSHGAAAVAALSRKLRGSIRVSHLDSICGFPPYLLAIIYILTSRSPRRRLPPGNYLTLILPTRR